ncbi:alpha/beta hydrolase [Tepidiforma sp.]|uniref:alpha/beta fold hydrolase n=1 Tax=Tepidiforma sp. TaxID=2682230 RepID=UPI002ADDA073|nr:alpha/beta hydrolase [Tepidiforma sp.]
MAWLERPTARIWYETHGPTDAPLVVFAHGLGGNHLSWWQQIPTFLDAGYRCLTFAHRGFAPSQQEGPEPGARAFADDLAALIDTANPTGSVTLVAQSMGGWTCLAFALANPTRVRALVMCDTHGGFWSPETASAWSAKPPAAEAELLARGIHPAAGERMAREQPALHYLYRGIDALATALDKETLRRQLGQLRTIAPADVARLDIPVLCIAGEEDIVIPPAAVEAFARAVPNGTFVTVPAAGHSVYFERATTFNAIVLDYLRAHP